MLSDGLKYQDSRMATCEEMKQDLAPFALHDAAAKSKGGPVLLRDGDREHACARDFVRRLDERRKELDFLPTVSFGSAEISSENVVTVKDRADHNMYRYKKERKARRMSGDAGEE